jgi:hypothetical protein
MSGVLQLTPVQYDRMSRINNAYETRVRPIKTWLETRANGHEDQPPYRDSVALITRSRAVADTSALRCRR